MLFATREVGGGDCDRVASNPTFRERWADMESDDENADPVFGLPHCQLERQERVGVVPAALEQTEPEDAVEAVGLSLGSAGRGREPLPARLATTVPAGDRPS